MFFLPLKQKKRDNQASVGGLNRTIVKLGRPSLLVGSALSDAERRNSFDNILTQSRQVDGQNKREGKVRSVKRGRDGMMMMAGMNKRSRSDTGVTSRPDVQVKIKLDIL